MSVDRRGNRMFPRYTYLILPSSAHRYRSQLFTDMMLSRTSPDPNLSTMAFSSGIASRLVFLPSCFSKLRQRLASHTVAAKTPR